MSFNLFKKSNNPNEEHKEGHPSTPRFRPKAKVETETCSVTSDSRKKGPISPFLKVSRCSPDNSDMEDSPLNPLPDCPPSPAKKRWLKVGKKVEADIKKSSPKEVGMSLKTVRQNTRFLNLFLSGDTRPYLGGTIQGHSFTFAHVFASCPNAFY